MKEEMMEIRDMIRRRYQVYGRVQGVGFRYTVTQAANALGLTGWVCNERDGSVTTELQLKRLDSTKKRVGSRIKFC